MANENVRFISSKYRNLVNSCKNKGFEGRKKHCKYTFY